MQAKTCLRLGLLPGAALGGFLGGALITTVVRSLSVPRERRGLFVRRRARRRCPRCAGFGISRCTLCTGEGICVRITIPITSTPHTNVPKVIHSPRYTSHPMSTVRQPAIHSLQNVLRKRSEACNEHLHSTCVSFSETFIRRGLVCLTTHCVCHTLRRRSCENARSTQVSAMCHWYPICTAIPVANPAPAITPQKAPTSAPSCAKGVLACGVTTADLRPIGRSFPRPTARP